MKHQVLFCLSLISFLSYSSEHSQVISREYLSYEMYWLHRQDHDVASSLEYDVMLANYRVILNTPMNKKDRKECLAIMQQAQQDNKSFEGLVEWSKSYDESGKMRKVHRS